MLNHRCIIKFFPPIVNDGNNLESWIVKYFLPSVFFFFFRENNKGSGFSKINFGYVKNIVF